MFYDEISEYYDQMIPFEKRLQSLREQLKPIVDKYKIKSALDAGSATGATCIALSELGVIPLGVELSRKMVEIAKGRASERGLEIEFRRGDLLKARPEFQGNFDAVFIIANTISHFLDKRSLGQLLRNFKRWLRPGGNLVVQLLNYERVFLHRERIVKIYNNNDRVFVRFYDFGKRLLNFNLLTIENRPGFADYSLRSVPLRGWKPGEIGDSLTKSGFSAIKIMGSFAGQKFIPSKSNDLILIAANKKSGRS